MMSMKNNLTFLTVQENCKATREGKSEGNKLAVWSRRGKTLLDNNDYIQIAESCSFDFIECLNDDLNSTKEAKKRIRKAYERNKQFVEFHFSDHKHNFKVEIFY